MKLVGTLSNLLRNPYYLNEQFVQNQSGVILSLYFWNKMCVFVCVWVCV